MLLRILTSLVPLVILGCPALFISTMIFITVVSPPLSEERWVEIFVAILSVITAVACWWYVVWPVVSFNFDNIEMNSSRDDKSRLRIQELRERSGRCRLMSWFVLFIMVTLALLGLAAPFISSEDVGSSEDVSRSVASLVLLTILIRALASIYRYNLRLSSFYDARADYLCLADNAKKFSHEELLELVGTDELDTTSIREFWHSFLGRSSSHEAKNRKPSHDGSVEPTGDG